MKLTHYTSIITVLLAFLVMSFAQSVQASGTDSTLWVGEYFNNTSRTGTPVLTRLDYDLEFDWGTGSPSARIQNDNFSVRWTSNVSLSAGIHRFWVRADDQISIEVDGQEVINTFSNNIVDQVVSGDISLNSGIHTIVVNYREFIGPAFVFFDSANLSLGETGPDFGNPQQPTPPPAGQWVVSYYDNPNLTGDPSGIFGGQAPSGDWGTGSPLASLPNDQWSARWQANLLFNGDTYIFRVQADDGVRVYVDAQLIIDEWHTARPTIYTAARSMTAGLHNVVVEYYESGGLAFLHFDYELSPDYTPPNDGIDNPEFLGVVTIATPRLNVRDRPSAFTGRILTKVSEGETYRALEFNASQTWVQINVNGTIGWVNASYVAFVPDTGTPDSTQYDVIASPYTVNIRSGPGTEFRDLGNLDDGDTAQVVGRNATATWWQINYDGIVGWVSARYAKIDSWANTDNIPITS